MDGMKKMIQKRSEKAVELAAIAVSLALCIWLAPPAKAQNSPARAEFARELSLSLLGAPDSFVDVGPGRGWRGVVLAPPGTSIAPLTEAYSGLPGGLSQTLANATVFDRPIAIKNGMAVFGLRTLDSAWGEILRITRPPAPLPRDRKLSNVVMKWLFKPIFKGKKIVGYTREPSRYVKRYKEFEASYAMLQRGKSNDMWRLDPRLRKYSSFEQADAAVQAEWLKSGYKSEVESATWAFESSSIGPVWRNWSSLNERFDAHRIPVDQFTRLPETYLFPPPASWSSVSTWMRLFSKSALEGSEVRFQLARIAVSRPWMDAESLIDGTLSFPNAGDGFVVSDGTPPSLDALPGGKFSAYVEELLLVRDIKVQNKEGVTYEHPLAAFAYPDAINLVGYVVRVMPKLPLQEPPLGTE